MVVALAAGAAVTAVLRRDLAPPHALLREAERHLAARHYPAAVEAASRVPPGASQFTRALLVAGEAATKLGRLDDALTRYASIPDGPGNEARLARLAAAEILLHRGDLSQAESHYRRVLRRSPDHGLATERLVRALDLQGRRWEAVPHVMRLIRLDAVTLEHLVHLGDVGRMVELDEADVAVFLARRDPGALLGVARVAVSYGRSERAESLLREALEKRPDLIEAQARLGHLLLGRKSEADFLRWHSALPPEADGHPEIWAVRGLRANDLGQPEAAARCMWEAVRRDPDHLLANFQLIRLLTQLGREADSQPFLRRSQELRELGTLLDAVYSRSATPTDLRRITELLESLGRLWESRAWCEAALANDPDDPSITRRLRRLNPLLKPDTPRTVPERNPALALDLSGYPAPAWGPSRPDPTEPPRPGAVVAFADRAAEAGIDFSYFNDPESSDPSGGWRMYQFTGGGAAALDFDVDSWPDLHLTQGCRWPAAEHAGSHSDRLYRNLGDGRFADVTLPAGTAEGGFSQGAAAGDLDGDGFPDLYVSNIGPNTLYRNNGDGTFADATAPAGIRGDWWTTGAVLADLDGDGHPEIFDGNFLTGDDVYDLVCRGESGRARSCLPTQFPAAPDVLYRNDGDGTFTDVTSTAGVVAPDGNALGVVAADFAGSGRLDLFVANDSTPNFYFANRSDGRGGPLSFEERAHALGVAVDRDGKPQACMGVACDDADGDGLLDLFVTNFYGESNTLYRQEPGGLFADDTRRAALRDPSLFLLGFGAQFLDADLDGRPDLVLTNGHVDDFTDAWIPYRMRPQFFRNAGDGRFEELRSPSLGPFFDTEVLGRGLTKLDWNRDGREEFVVSHLLGDPVALVTNETAGAGRHLAIHLRGTRAARDAIGTTVTLTAGGRTLTRQLTAGDGYMASNERRLVFGLGDAETVDALEVRWPGGGVQRFENLDAGTELLLVQGLGKPLRLPPPRD